MQILYKNDSNSYLHCKCNGGNRIFLWPKPFAHENDAASDPVGSIFCRVCSAILNSTTRISPKKKKNKQNSNHTSSSHNKRSTLVSSRKSLFIFLKYGKSLLFTDLIEGKYAHHYLPYSFNNIGREYTFLPGIFKAGKSQLWGLISWGIRHILKNNKLV